MATFEVIEESAAPSPSAVKTNDNPFIEHLLGLSAASTERGETLVMKVTDHDKSARATKNMISRAAKTLGIAVQTWEVDEAVYASFQGVA